MIRHDLSNKTKILQYLLNFNTLNQTLNQICLRKGYATVMSMGKILVMKMCQRMTNLRKI